MKRKFGFGGRNNFCRAAVAELATNFVTFLEVLS